MHGLNEAGPVRHGNAFADVGQGRRLCELGFGALIYRGLRGRTCSVEASKSPNFFTMTGDVYSWSSVSSSSSSRSSSSQSNHHQNAIEHVDVRKRASAQTIVEVLNACESVSITTLLKNTTAAALSDTHPLAWALAPTIPRPAAAAQYVYQTEHKIGSF